MPTPVGQFTLRGEGDVNNPFAARLYGKGITAGRNVFYINNALGLNRTAMLVILAQGARGVDDFGCNSVDRVYYAGFEIPEHGSGWSLWNEDPTDNDRNWKFHPGTVSGAPDYKGGYTVDTGTNEMVCSENHGYETGDVIAFWKRGADVVMPTISAPAFWGLSPNSLHLVEKTSDTRFKLYVREGYSIVPNPTQMLDFSSTGTNLDRLFSYKKGTFLFDPTQGRPLMFGNLNFTFAGLSYLELLLPENLSTGEEEPTNLKVVMQGKKMYGLKDVGGVLTFDETIITAQPNNALVTVDALYHEGKHPMTRFGTDSFLAWRDRCDETIPWVGGNSVAAQRSDWDTISNQTFDVDLNKLTKTAGGAGWTGGAWTEEFTGDYASVEFRYTGSKCRVSFTSNDVNSGYLDQGVMCADGFLTYIYFDENITFEVISLAVGDKIKITYENGSFTIFKNAVPMPMVTNTYSQVLSTWRVGLEIWEEAGTIDQIFIAPAGTDSIPRQIKRFQGGFVAPEAIPVSDLLESEVSLSAASWADINGKIEIATEPDRTPCFAFVYDPNGSTPSNVSKITVKRRNPEDVSNFWSYVYRDDDDMILTKKFATADRPLRRADNDGRLITSGVIQFGVLSQSQMDRLAEMRARIESDLDIGFTVEAFLDSLPVCKGSFVTLAAPEAGYEVGDPCLCVVIDERLSLKDVETRIFELQIVTPDFYSDTDHGVVTPNASSVTTAAYIPPPIVTSLDLTETTEPLPNGQVVASLSGEVEFGVATAQRGRVFTKTLKEGKFTATLDDATDIFTDLSGAPDDDTQLSLGSTSNDMPAGYTVDVPLFVINSSGNEFQLSLSEGGAAIDFTTPGADLVFYDYTPWHDTGIDVIPNDANTGAFEIIPARKSLTQVRVQTFSTAGVTMPFKSHLFSQIDILGDLTPPLPPASATAAFDDVKLKFTWTPSPSFGVSAYVLRDEFGNHVTQVDGLTLSYVETAQADRVTRRIYSVNSTGILSQTYAEVTWAFPVPTNWINLRNVTTNPDNSLNVGSKGGYYERAVLNKAVLTDAVEFELSAAPDRNDITQIVGLTYTSTPGAVSDYEFAMKFNSDGSLQAWYGADGGSYMPGSESYLAGEVYVIKSEPLSADPSIVTVCKREVVAGEIVDTELWQFSNDYSRHSLMFAAVSFDTGSVTSQVNLRLTGDLVEAVGMTPADDETVTPTNVTYSAGTLLQSGGGGGPGESGASFAGLLAGQDGAWQFKVVDPIGDGVRIGLVTEDLAQHDYSDWPIYIHVDETYQGYFYINGVSIGDFPVDEGVSIQISRDAGKIRIWRDGLATISYTPTGGYAALATDDLFLDTDILDGSGITALKFFKSSIASTTENRSVTADLLPSARVGVNLAKDIPPFNVVDPTDGQIMRYDAASGKWFSGTDYLGTVTEITLLDTTGLFSITGSPVTGDGTISLNPATQVANKFYASPNGGGGGAASFRSIVAADLPSLSGIYQPVDATLTALAGQNWAANSIPLGSGADTMSQLAIAANTFPARSSSGNVLAKPITDFGLSLVDDADATAGRVTLGVVIGTNVQAYHANLAALAGLSGVADKGFYFTGSGAMALMDVSSFSRTLLDDTTAAAWRTTLGIDTDDAVTFGDLTVNNLVVNGTTMTVNTATITVDDPLIRLADNNGADSVDVGFYGVYVSAGTKYTGLFRDASDGKYRLYHGSNTEPTTTVNIAAGGHTVSTLIANIEGAVTGNASTATTLATPRAIYGNNFDGSAALTQVIATTYGGTGTGAAFTAGSLVFAGPSGVYAQDNANLFWDDTNNRLGIGTAAPNYALEVNGTIGLYSSAGTTYAPTMSHGLSSPFAIFTVASRGGTGAWRGAINFDTNYNAGSLFTAMTIKANTDGTTANVGIGTASPQSALHMKGDFLNSVGTLAHGMTGIVPTDVYYSFNASDTAWGGAYIQGFTQVGSGTPPIYLRGVFGAAPSAGVAAVNIGGVQKSGTATAALSATDLILKIDATAKVVFEQSGNVGFGMASGPAARVHLISTTEQLRVGYDASNYYKTTVGSTGDVTFDAVGSGAAFTFSDSVTARIKPRTDTVASSATPTINTDNVDFFDITALTVNITSMTTNLSGTPTKGQKLWIAITGTAARTITWGASFEAGAAALPTTTVTTTRLDVHFVWNNVTSKWRCMAAG